MPSPVAPFAVAGPEAVRARPTGHDPVLRMARNGTLDAEQIRAAMEIRRVAEWLETCSLATISWDTIGTPPPGVAGTPASSLERAPERLARILNDRFLPWRETAERQPNGTLTWYSTVIGAVATGRSLASLDRAAGVRNGMSGSVLKRALASYGQAE